MNKSLDPLFRKIDLHVHTPESTCYSNKSVSPENIVDAAIAAGLDAIAITDHNTVSAIEDIQQSAKNRNLVIFPGIELSTSEGHFISLFNLDKPIRHLEKLLEQMGVPGDAGGDGARVIDLPIESVFQNIVQEEGLLIAAHIERWPSGFLEAKISRRHKMMIHNSPYLHALEITIPQNKALWNQGKMTGYPKKYPCIQSSDAHAPDEIGRRFTYIQMSAINLSGLRAAFAEFENNIDFPANNI